MAKMTREQVQKINAGCENGWGFYIYGFMMRGEKELAKKIELGDDGKRYMEAILYFAERRNGNIPMLHLSIYTRTSSGCAVSPGLGNFIPCGEAVTRKNMSILQGLTSLWTDAEILALYEERTATAPLLD